MGSDIDKRDKTQVRIATFAIGFLLLAGFLYSFTLYSYFARWHFPLLGAWLWGLTLFAGLACFVALLLLARKPHVPVVLLVMVIITVPFFLLAVAHDHIIGDEIRAKNIVLHQLDPIRLLAACREVIKDRQRFRPDPNRSGGDIDPRDPNLPDMIKMLRPTFIDVDNEHMVLSCGYYFLFAYVEGRNPDLTPELVPGLVYREREITPGIDYP